MHGRRCRYDRVATAISNEFSLHKRVEFSSENGACMISKSAINDIMIFLTIRRGPTLCAHFIGLSSQIEVHCCVEWILFVEHQWIDGLPK